ncbi:MULTISPECIES: GGDEF domain-containing protein [unclassified Pseudoalteromonas]|uniref:EAL domain-containing protein n=1 Tax=unclassified Pseudoalteromonas TaxID=194690 RepID=UPI000B3C198E|nr:MULTISPECIES: GGDEF domain-containing protein [unclassified Pseudoalteromonas]MDN3378280.1 GGDEF domain-containing protein [Pseudoalteromonas sp. APC 3893]MDN3386200.1 GGDEF domain-containing protein [Pseudoalteromonas sp. APC 4017]OUS70166.1 GGDEF domain-containing protein [Pseudoalteromonas sp. A601]
MISASLRTNWIIAGFLVFLISLLSYVYYTYHTTRADIMRQVDARLLNAAVSVKHILGNEYHDQINAGVLIPHSMYQLKSRQLSEFANALDVAYVYSMVLKDSNVHFSASSYTQEDQNSGKVTQFLDLYPEATKANISAFYSTEPVFETSKDQWGHFKSIFVPYVDKNGHTYLTGADITIYDLNEQLSESVSKAAALASFFFFIALLVAGIYIYLLKRALSTDSSSGYANHIALDYYIKQSSTSHMQVAVIWVNEIEDINSFYGTEVGDKVMKCLLEHFALRRPASSKIFRLATNKIVLIAPFDEEHTGFSDLIQNYNCSTPLLTDPFIYITLCAGIASGNKAMLLENAHIAALQAKQGRFNVVNYSIALHDVKNQYQYNVEMAKDVREAFENNRIVPYFQPVYDYENNSIIQYECLARMITCHGEILLPDAFLNVVNRSRMDGMLTRTMLNQCFERFRKTSICWSINITAQDMLDPSLTEFLADELKRYPQPSNITLELLETEAIANFSEVKTFISMVKQRGVKVIIDDFGTGYSNISNVLKLDVDGIKLDGSLIRQIINDQDIYLYIEHIASFAKQLNLHVIAECVESKPIVNALIKAKVNLMQGHYFACAAPQISPHTQIVNPNRLLAGDSVDHSPNIYAQTE